MVETDILIIGGGLAGLSLAAQLTAEGRDIAVVEARPRLGGRILAQAHGGARFDMGPAWFWPGQPRIAALIRRLGLTHFDQYATGDLVFEDEHGQVQHGRGFASMEGSYRLRGGLGTLIEALSLAIPQDRIHLNAPIRSLAKSEAGITATALDGRVFKAHRVVLALPPRIAGTLSFTPALPVQAHQAMDGVATWMAGQAKAVAVYDRPFWRDAGLSGDAMSRFGPMAEIHDASPFDAGPSALFGFIGMPPEARQDEAALKAHVLAQLGRLFGEAAAYPTALFLKDWARDPYSSTPKDWKPLHAHPRYGMPAALQTLWQGHLIFGGTEVAPAFGGYLEGALEAAENTFAVLNREAACP